MQKAVVTHRMSPALYSRLQKRANRAGVSINQMYDAIMTAIVDGQLGYIAQHREFINEQTGEKFIEVPDSSCTKTEQSVEPALASCN